MIERILAELSIPVARWQRPILIAIMGLPAVGKTDIARHLASRLPHVVLSTDAIRLRYGLPSGPETHEVMFQVAARLLPRNVGIVWDGIHLRRQNRRQMEAFADRFGAHYELIYATASDEAIQQRLAVRLAWPEQTLADDKFVITPEHFERIAGFLDPPGSDDRVVIVDTTQGRVDEQIEPLIERLASLLAVGTR